MADPSNAIADDRTWLLAHSSLAGAVAAVGTAEQAAREFVLVSPYRGRVPFQGCDAGQPVDLALATLAASAGWPERAERHFADAHEQHVRLGAPIWLARTQLEWGRFLLDTGETDRAKTLLEEARDGAERMGAADVVVAAGSLRT